MQQLHKNDKVLQGTGRLVGRRKKEKRFGILQKTAAKDWFVERLRKEKRKKIKRQIKKMGNKKKRKERLRERT